MPLSPLRLLLVEDNPADARLVQELLRDGELKAPSVTRAAKLREALDLLRESNFNAIVLDLGLPDSQGLETFARVHAQAPDVPILVLSGLHDEKLAMEAVAAGAQDYLVKGQVDGHTLGHAIRYAIERTNSEAKIRSLMLALDQSPAAAIVTDPSGTITYVNRRFTELTGYSTDEALGRNPRLLKSGETPVETYRALWSTILAGGTWRGELLNRRKNGELYWNAVSISPIRDARGAITHLVSTQDDISARKKAEETLRSSAERHRILFENSPLPKWLYDLETLRFLAVNEAAVQDYGYSREEFLQMTIKDIRPAEDVEALVQGVHHAGELPKAFGTWRHRKKDGTLIDVEITTHTFSLNGRQTRMVVAQDFTERKRAEHALRASEAEFRLLAEAMPQIVWVTEPDGRNIYFNRQWTEYTGLSREESRGDGWNGPFHPDDRQRAWEAWQAATAGIGTYSLECRLRRADGAYFWWLVRGVPALDASGKIVKWFGTCTDIDAMKQAEQKLRLDEALLRIAGNIAKLGGWSLSVPEHQVTWSNEVRAIQEAPSGTEPGLEQALEFYPPEFRQTIGSHVEACERDGTPFDVEVQMVTPKGRRKWVRVIGNAERDRSGAITMLRGVLQDVDERRGLEEQLRQAQRLEAIGSLAGGVAHDFNNILSVILTYSELLIGDLEPGAPMRADLLEIKNAGQKAAELTRQLLAFSRRQVLQPRVVDLNQVVAGMEKMLRRLIGEDVELSVIPSPSPARVSVDPSQMEQVLMNLAVNARDAMPQGGKLTIEIGETLLDKAYATKHGASPGPHVMLAVSDTGTGMDAATQARVFEPFFTTKEVGKGTGLGLSTVFGIVRQSGGSIWLYSEPGKGTTFKVYLPAVAQDFETPGARSAEPAVLRGSETILLVEDEEGVRKAVRGILERNGYHVLEARSGDDALAISEQHPAFQLLLTDVVMPRMSGAQLTARLHAIRPELKVVYMSGYTDNAVVLHGVLHAEVAFVQKPITPLALLTRIREVLDSPPPAPRPS